jgi:hypothetical protein
LIAELGVRPTARFARAVPEWVLVKMIRTKTSNVLKEGELGCFLTERSQSRGRFGETVEGDGARVARGLPKVPYKISRGRNRPKKSIKNWGNS